MLLGLITPTGGDGEVLGHPIDRPATYLHRVGALIEAPAFYPTLTGEENLRAFARLGGHDRRRIAELLEVVGLGERGGDRYKNYSLGMKQRLGIAAALLKDPSLLILDEPANGLDPEGIAWMRRLLRGFADAGSTVLLSSHLLAEVEATVDRLVVIGGGRIVAQGTLSDLLVSAGLIVRAADSDRHALRDLLDQHQVLFTEREDGALAVETPDGFDAERLVYASIEGMLRTLDPHSNYYDREEFEELKTDQRSEYFGIGASIQNYIHGDKADTYITATFDGSPAAKAGLRYGDRIVEVDGVKMTGMALDSTGTIFSAMRKYSMARAATSSVSSSRFFCITL